MYTRELLFHGFQATGWMWFSLVVVLAAAVCVVMLMQYERRLVPRSVGYGLLALRIAVLVMLFLTLMQPVLSWTLDRKRTGRIVVAVDLSESMETADRHASPVEKLRWARALEMIGNPDIDRRLDQWLDDLEAGRTPEWVSESEEADPDRRNQLAAARKENLKGIFDEINRLSRREIVLRLLKQTSSPLLADLNKVGNVELVVFAGKSEAADEKTLPNFVGKPPLTLLTSVSDLSQAFTGASVDEETTKVLGVVLFTDGRDNAGRNAVGLATQLGQMEVPVYPVMLGSELRPKDLAIATLEYPQRAYKDDQPFLKATLNTSGFENEEIEIILEREDEEPVSKTVTADGPTATVEFALDATKIGREQYTIRTAPRPGETREDNNSKKFAMTVVDDKSRVLLVEGEARWEFRFVDNALQRDEHVEAKQVVFDQPFLGQLNDTFFPRRLDLPADADNLAASPFSEPDLVIVGDVAPEHMPDVGWELLEKFVSESGGTLVFVAGKRHLPLGYKSEILDRLLPMQKLKPVDITGASATASPTERGFHLRLTPEGESEEMLKFSRDPLENREIWSELPGHLWGLIGEAKPGATVYAYAVQPNQQPGLQAERTAAVIVHQYYGAGQVLWVGIDSTWRWRHRVGDQYHHQFWGQLARWAADSKADAGTEDVKFGPDRTDIEVGEDAVIRARWTRRFLKRFPRLKAKAEIRKVDAKKNSKPFQTLDLTPAEGRPLEHEARAVALPSGEYRVKLVVEGADLGDDDVSTFLYVNEQQTLELSDLSSNRQLLTEVADASDGRLFLPDQVREIPDLFRDPNLTSTVRSETELWDHWFVMLLFFGLLTGEWVLRKLNGLP